MCNHTSGGLVDGGNNRSISQNNWGTKDIRSMKEDERT